jgi:hypothetical protein
MKTIKEDETVSEIWAMPSRVVILERSVCAYLTVIVQLDSIGLFLCLQESTNKRSDERLPGEDKIF